MTADEPFFLDEDATRPTTPLETPPLGQGRGWKFWIRLTFVIAVVAAAGIEGLGRLAVARTRSGLQKLIDSRAKVVKGLYGEPDRFYVRPALTLAEIRQQTFLLPSESSIPRGRGKILIFRWPSLLSVCQLRVHVASDERVLSIDTAEVADDDFTEAMVTGDNDGMSLGVAPRKSTVQAARFDPVVSPEVATQDAFLLVPSRPPAGVLITPFVGLDEKTHRIGPALSVIASYMVAIDRQPVMDFDPRFHADALRELNLTKPGWLIDAKRRAVLKTMVNSKQVVWSTLTEDGTDFILKSHFETDVPGSEPATFEHRVPQNEAQRLPVLLAQDLWRHLKIPAKRDAQAWSDASVDSVHTLETFQDWLTDWPGRDSPYNKLSRAVAQNIKCVAIADLNQGLDLMGTTSKDSPWLYRLHYNDFKEYPFEPHPSLYPKLVAYAPLLRGQPRFHKALCDMAVRMKDEKLVEQLLQIWEKEDSSTAGTTLRAQFLINWGWNARGNGVPGMDGRQNDQRLQDAIKAMDRTIAQQTKAGNMQVVEAIKKTKADLEKELNPTPVDGFSLFDERLQLARKLLDHAVLDPQAWKAHCLLIIIGKAQGEDYDWFMDHLRAATQLVPDNRLPYHGVHDALMKRWGGDEASRLEFARECLKAGQWQAGIPMVLPRVLAEEASGDIGEGNSYAAWRSNSLWPLMKEFSAAAEAQPDVKIRDEARIWYITGGLKGDHIDDIAVQFDWLAALPREERLELLAKSHFRDDARFTFYTDLVNARRSDRKPDPLAVARVALVEARPSAAESALRDFQGDLPEATAEVERLQRAIKWAQTLADNGNLELTAEQLLETCLQVGPNGISPLKGDSRWSTADGNLCWDVPVTNVSLEETTLMLPFGLKNFVATGVLENVTDREATLELVLNAQGLRDATTLQFRAGTAKAFRGHSYLLDSFPVDIRVPVAEFELQSDAEAEVLVPLARTVWKAPVFDNVPATLAFVLSTKNAARFKIRNLRFNKL